MAAANPLPQDEAFDLVFQQVQAPVFFNKLANDHGIKPANAEEAREMLKLAAKLRVLYDAEQQQKTAGSVSLLTKASAALDAELANRGLSQAAGASDEQAKQAAATGALNPALAHAVLSLQLAARQQPAA